MAAIDEDSRAFLSLGAGCADDCLKSLWFVGYHCKHGARDGSVNFCGVDHWPSSLRQPVVVPVGDEQSKEGNAAAKCRRQGFSDQIGCPGEHDKSSGDEAQNKYDRRDWSDGWVLCLRKNRA